MPPYKEQGVVLRSIKLGEADKIVTVMTQGSGKVRAVAKGIRKTTSRFGARLEPFTHVSLMLYHGRGQLDTITQAEIIAPHMAIREDLGLFAAGETMLEAVDKVAEEHERNRWALLLLAGVRALDTRPADPGAVAESFMLKLLSLSGFHPFAHRVCGLRCDRPLQLFSPGMGGAICPNCAEGGVGAGLTGAALARLQHLAALNLNDVGATWSRPTRASARNRAGWLYGFAEYHLERRMRSLPMLARSAP